MKNLQWLALDLSNSLLLSADFSTVLTFVYTYVLTFHSHFFHFICKEVLHSLLYYSDNQSLHSILFLFLYFSDPLYHISNSIALTTLYVNPTVLISFIVLADKVVFKENFHFAEVHVTRCPGQVATVAVTATNKIVQRMEVKVSGRETVLKESQFEKLDRLVLPVHGAEPFLQVISAFLAIHTYVMKGNLIRELFFHFFCKKNFCAALLDCARFLQLVLDHSYGNVLVSYEIIVSRAIDA